MGNRKLMNTTNKVILLIVAIACVLFYMGISSSLDFNLKQKIILISYLVIIYLIIIALLSKFKEYILKLSKRRTKIIPKTIIKEIEKPIIIKEPQKRELKFKYYGSTKSKTYHLRKCRFSGMIKQKYLIEKNSNAHFKKNKFHACKNCMPGRK